jgi:hypothetical protein
VSEREIAAEIVRAWRQGHVGSYVWQDTMGDLIARITDALADAHAATERVERERNKWMNDALTLTAERDEERKRTAWHWHHIAQHQGERAERLEAEVAALRAALRTWVAYIEGAYDGDINYMEDTLPESHPWRTTAALQLDAVQRTAPGDASKTSSEPGA